MRALRVLVADDQEHMRELMVEALSADGHTVDPAEDGVAALKLLEQQTYDLVVSDLQMPQVDGPKLYQEIRRLKPDAAPFFIFITGEDEAPGYGRFSPSRGARRDQAVQAQGVPPDAGEAVPG
jgi:CheY-like chemotaxis protein